MKLLLIEDEVQLTKVLSYLLQKNGYVVKVATDGTAGLDMALTGEYDIIVLDWLLPGQDGKAIVKELRRHKLDVPILLMTAKDGLKDRIEGLDSGADDYLVKPFSTDELLARLRALLRRANRVITDNTITAAGMKLDPLKNEVIKDNKVIQLSVKEASLLELLMSHSGQVITKERIFERVWGYYSKSEFSNIDLYIHYLRKKLNTPCIKTVRGVGYYLKEEQDVS
ncbi:DNA-binding response OmpR family regulator [Hydrogenispora ethanolica]|uniref:DNA-binding response OmpR family regulator n=1 Tax=Hydrogenispora ethanolica TaxID=1082276 RepID=A0A4R1SBC5_HYDET|nr:response regulator transcription factor [Hydrogenispora ethanolica]TCL76300.1 DNA-binding response OmpR family regulator [Hydrogenispora ethanolica]